MKDLSPIAALAVLLAAAPPAAAFDFTFDVPVEVHNLPPQVLVLQVLCDLRHDADRVGGDTYGSGAVLKDGSFVGTVTVAFNVNRSRVDPRRANNYICSLQFPRADGGGNFTGPAAPGAVMSVSGPLPPIH